MSDIKILPDSVINKIAAGEVLERPMSAVKELVENSLDANSKKIDIFIRNGGRSEIIVSDNGNGIKEDQLKNAILRHATSKLNSSRLNSIKTMGFRGEALSSIAAVSDFSLSSNQSNDSEGYEIKMVSGELKYIKPISQKKGSRVSVKNVFFSTPARLKFLKSENYESLLIKRLIQRFAIINFDVEFNLFIDKKNVIRTTVYRDLEKRNRFISRVKEILGTDFIKNSFELSEITNNLSLEGLLCLPTFNYSNSNNQFIFVNGRIINDKSLNTIFKIAYRDVMFRDRFPQLILNIKCPLDWVDINVHPMKNEVRFEDIDFLKSFIIKAFRNRLEQIGHKISSSKSTKTTDKISFQENLVLKENSNLSKNYKINQDVLSREYQDTKSLYPLGFAKSQFHENYIISQTESGIIIVDQHAAHERIVYEKLKSDYYNNKVKTQILLIPVIINVESLVLKDLESNFKKLRKYGLKIELFGSNSIIVREVPLLISDCDVKKLVEALAMEIVDYNSFDSVEKEINQICSTIACYGSIRSGRKLEVQEMNNLLRKMENTAYSGQCNHGRPTYIELNLNEIEKLFGRK